MIKQASIAIAAVAGLLGPASAQAGPEFTLPVLRAGSAFESSAPKYQLVGIGVFDNDCTAWVVADAKSVFDQATVNKIVLGVNQRLRLIPELSCPLSIMFYGAVRQEPQFPAFALMDYLGGYYAKENRINFMGDEKTYGSWVDGPSELRPQSSTAAEPPPAVHAVQVSVMLPGRDPLDILVSYDEATKLTGEKLEYSIDFWIRAAFAKAGLEYSIGKTGAAHEITAINSVRNGEAGRWVYFVNDIRSPYHIDSQSSESVKTIRFAYQKAAPR